MSDARIDLIVHHFHPPKGVKLWHGGATVQGALRGVSAQAAAWKPAPARHSIWGLTLHIAYWNYAVLRRLTGDEPGTFPRAPSNFPHVPDDVTDKAWMADRAVLRDYHERLLGALRALDPTRLDEPTGKGEYTIADLANGIVLHDVYHAGQIQMMKRLWAERATIVPRGA